VFFIFKVVFYADSVENVLHLSDVDAQNPRSKQFKLTDFPFGLVSFTSIYRFQFRLKTSFLIFERPLLYIFSQRILRFPGLIFRFYAMPFSERVESPYIAETEFRRRIKLAELAFLL
jgi:hypothetical protein